MKRQQGTTFFLKIVLILMAIPVCAVGIIWLPGMVQRDAAAHPETAYLSYLFFIYTYTLCIPYLMALYQAYRLLTNIDQNKAFSDSSVRVLKKIKQCAMTIVLFLLTGITLSMILFYGKEDMTGIIMMALISIFVSSTIAIFAAVLHRLLQKTVELQSENELTV
ncbi:DUF2975 domain-containing protein [Lysinibacillus sp. FSL R7-0073]|uniref:DUF2975 domain-containing protein n=1 Tax=Lysinibacillus TaxID=400634 RepID=UPI00215B27BF|nr:DUF2975 domain-containing protein [Lysinibacillus fusiformis]MCR8852461.1 DUF2975 domain-containing protein [Lysinibacillus fusiformis]MED4889662.1 DUF2975 domain-containing protein [Lysinibacillus fusiformis]WKT78941.1 DUF2975 domain-containing protein [Lysinibacillus fusiformis]